VPRRR